MRRVNIIVNLHKNRMYGLKYVLPLFLVFFSAPGHTQDFEILIKGGHVIDPKNHIDTQMDVGIADGKISRVANDIEAGRAKKVIDATGLYVTPGLIDLHTHVFVGSEQGFANGFSSVSPDDITLKAGITTVVDAGTSGWRNFPLLRAPINCGLPRIPPSMVTTPLVSV